jgi:hypothetical protein
MARNGYISSSGIDQVFTTGPYAGSIVTSSYSSGSTLLGPTISFYQTFLSESIIPCNNITDSNLQQGVSSDIFLRYYYDPIECPVGDCFPPTITSAVPVTCVNAIDYRYWLFFDSGSTNALYSTIEYSTVSDFSFNTGSVIVTNSLSTYTSSINIGNLSLLPTKLNPVYFRIFNSCSLGGTSSYSPVISASCQLVPPPSVSPFTVRLKNSMIGDNNTLYYKNNSIEYALFGGTTVNLTIPTLSSLQINFTTLQLDGFVHTIIASSSFTFNGSVTTTLIDDTPDYFGDIINQSINTYPGNLYYNSSGTPDAAVVVDRTNWNGSGLIEIDFTSQTPVNEDNPWFYILQDVQAAEGGGSN